MVVTHLLSKGFIKSYSPDMKKLWCPHHKITLTDTYNSHLTLVVVMEKCRLED